MVARNLLRALTFAAMVVCVSDSDSSVLTRELSKMASSTASASLSTALNELAETATKTSESELFSDVGSNDGGTVKPYADDSDNARHESEQAEHSTASITEKGVTTASASGDEMESSKSIFSSNSEMESSKRVSSGRKEKSSAATLSEINSGSIRDMTGSRATSEAEGSSDSTNNKEMGSSSNSDPPSSGDVTQVASSSDGAITQGASSFSGDVTQDTLPFGGNVKHKYEDEDDENAAAKSTMAKREAAKEARHKAQAERKAKREAQKKEWRKIKEQQMADLKAARERVKSNTSGIQAAAGFTVNSTDTTQDE